MTERNPVVLLTRPQAQADTMMDALKQAAYDVLLAPMLEIENLSYDRPDISQYDGLIFTSVNAVRAFAADDVVRAMPVYCVGEKTADTLRILEYETIKNISGNIDLLEKAMTNCAGRYLHPCGVDVVRAMDLAGAVIDLLPVYKAHKITRFSPEIAEKLTQQHVDVVLFYSARTGQAFVHAVNDAGCTSALKATKALCLSDLVINSIKDLPWRSVHTAKTPDGDAMIEALKGILKNITS